MEASVYVLSDVNQTVLWNDDLQQWSFADIVKVFQHVQSGHPDKPLGRIPQHLLRMRFNVIGYWPKKWQGKMVTTRRNSVS